MNSGFPTFLSGIGPLRLISLTLLALLSVGASSYKLIWFSNAWQSEVFSLTIALLGGVLVNLVARFCFSVLAEQNGQKLVLAYRNALFQRMLSADIEHGPNRIGVAMNRLISDANGVAHFAGRGLAYGQMGGIGLIVFGWLLFMQNQKLAFSVLLAVIIVFAFIASITLWALRFAGNIRTSRGRLSGHLSERCFGYLNVARMRNQGKEVKRIDRRGRDLAWQLVYWRGGILICRSLAPLTVTTLIVLNSKDMNIMAWSSLVRVLILSLCLLSIDYLIRSWADWVNFYVARKRLKLAHDRCTLTTKRAEHRLKRFQRYDLKLRQLRILSAMPECNAEIAAGERILICGHVGKSMLCRALAQQREPVSGFLVLGRRRFENLDFRRLQQLIVVIDEFSQLFKGSIYSNILYGTGKKRSAEVETFITKLGFNESLLDSQVAELGRGCPQSLVARILLARALLIQPAVLVIDLPVFIAHPEIRQLLKDVAEQHSFTLLLVSEPELAPIAYTGVLNVDKGQLTAP
nr:ABC transporter ATP-binding protein [Lelliottia steviae]